MLNSVLEHLSDPIRAVEEADRILKPGGKVLEYVPFLYPYHGKPDLWRMTKDGLLYCFREFEFIRLQPVFGYMGTLLRFLTGFRWGKCYPSRLENLMNRLVAFARGHPVNSAHNITGFNFFAVKRAGD